MATFPTGTGRAKRALMGAFAAVLTISLLGLDPALAEFQLGAYGGFSEGFDSDVTIVQPGGTNLTLGDVPWDGKSFTWPPYWACVELSGSTPIPAGV
ncbi:MAG: hypothetical protein ACREDO_05085 [Methyloceanibacter sp.]